MAKQLQLRDKWFAYVHYIEDRGIFYVGKGTRKRAYETNPNRRNAHYNSVVSKYGNTPSVGTLPCSTEAIAFELERGLIKCLKRQKVKLTNKTEGGEGASGRVVPAEERIKMSKRRLGKHHSATTRQKISEKLKGNTNGKYSKVEYTEEIRKNISNAQKLRYQRNPDSEETRRRKRIAGSGRTYADTTCPFCGKTGKESGMRSWHFDYCKNNPNKKVRGNNGC